MVADQLGLGKFATGAMVDQVLDFAEGASVHATATLRIQGVIYSNLASRELWAGEPPRGYRYPLNRSQVATCIRSRALQMIGIAGN